MPLEKRKTVMKSFVTSQFVYCLFAWMFHGFNDKINSLHERVLRITSEKSSSFQYLFF